ncbi:unnamed protein product [Ilex paraguariensis]|uniref:Uncharacterized protein n=1 Tax=Ilex paraguariensis TaxID=185542 RepID=A0ABC8RH27_9AQUA
MVMLCKQPKSKWELICSVFYHRFTKECCHGFLSVLLNSGMINLSRQRTIIVVRNCCPSSLPVAYIFLQAIPPLGLKSMESVAVLTFVQGINVDINNDQVVVCSITVEGLRGDHFGLGSCKASCLHLNLSRPRRKIPFQNIPSSPSASRSSLNSHPLDQEKLAVCAESLSRLCSTGQVLVRVMVHKDPI